MKAKAAKSIWIMSFELDRIEELCNDRGWSHYRLAKEMEISPNSIGNLFRRTTVPSIPTIRHICQVFGISMSEFYSTEGSQAVLSKQKGKLFYFFRNSPYSHSARADIIALYLLVSSNKEEKVSCASR